MTFGSLLPQLLAHGESETMSFGELLFSVGLLVISCGIGAALLIIVFLRPIRRLRKQWKEGRVPKHKKLIYSSLVVIIVLFFADAVWDYAWAIYYDYHFQQYEKNLMESGKHLVGGVEYKWNRWHIYGVYGDNKIAFFVDDVLGKKAAENSLELTAREISPNQGQWKNLQWNAEKKVFEGDFPATGDRIDIEFRLKSGWNDYSDVFIGYRRVSVPKGGVSEEEVEHAQQGGQHSAH